MATLAIMKARIADEIGPRSDLDSQIAYAISDAIEAYEDERYYFNESRALTLTTVPTQEFYDDADLAALANLIDIDYLMLFVGDQPYELDAMRPVDAEWSSTNGTSSGQPYWYSYYSQKIRLYPVPAEAWTIRVSGGVKVAAPATDEETGNKWMVDAARLIRSRAKLELALHVLHDEEMAITLSQAVMEAEEQLEAKSMKIMQIGQGRVRPMVM